MICRTCWKQINDTAQFCPYCGQKTAVQQAGGQTGGSFVPNQHVVNAAPVQTPKKKNPLVPIVIGLVIAFTAVSGTAVGLYLGRDARPAQGSADSEERKSSKSSDPKESSDGKGKEKTDDPAPSTPMNAASAKELMGYIDQAEQLIAEADEKMGALAAEQAEILEGSEYLSHQEEIYSIYGQLETISADTVSALSDLKDKARSVTDIDEKLKNAGQEYFDMVCDPRKAYSDIWSFLDDFMPFILYLDQRSLYMDSYDELYDWYLTARASYDAIAFCPLAMQSQWKRFGEALDLNESICYKAYESELYDDALRLASAENLSVRYETLLLSLVGEMMECIENESSHIGKQAAIASSLAEEMHAYAGLGEADRSRYKFANIASGTIYLDYEPIETIYPSLYNTYEAFLIVKAGCASGTRQVLIEAEIPGLTQKYRESVTVDSAYTEIYVKPAALSGDLNLSTAREAQIQLTVSEQDGTLIEARTFPVTVKSKYDFEWYTDEYGIATQDNILCFLTPESPAISQLKRLAIDEIDSMTGGNMQSFVGYQSNYWGNNYVGTYLQAAGIMRALFEQGVRYNMDTYSMSGSNQHILFPEDVLKQKSGLCVETSLVVASALMSAGMHVYLIFPPGHAQVAVEVWGWEGEGIGEYFLIETTALSSDWNNEDVFVADANELLNYNVLNESPVQYHDTEWWAEYIWDEGAYVIDCSDLNILGMAAFAN